MYKYTWMAGVGGYKSKVLVLFEDILIRSQKTPQICTSHRAVTKKFSWHCQNIRFQWIERY